MNYLKGMILAGGLLLGLAGESSAQVALSIGTPGSGYGGYGSPGYAGGFNSIYNSGYVAGPGTFRYSSGYGGLAPNYGLGYGGYPYASPVVRPYGYGYRPYYGGYGYGYRAGGFRPFRGVGRVFR